MQSREGSNLSSAPLARVVPFRTIIHPRKATRTESFDVTHGSPGLSVVIVGAGLMGRWHLDAARRSGARVVAVVDRDPGRAHALGGRALVHASLAEALQEPVDVVHVCTPASTHVPLCHEALAAGCHVIVEKPATPTAAEAVALDAAARAAGRLVVPVHQFLFQPGVQAIHAHIRGIGPIHHLEFATASAGADARGADRDTVAAEILPHALSLSRNLLDVQVSMLEWQLERPAPGEWRARATTPQGCSITALISLRARPTFASLRVLGERGSVVADLFHGFAVFEPAGASRSYKMIRPLAVGINTATRAAVNLLGRTVRRERAYPGLRALCAATYAAIRGGEVPFASGEIVDVATVRDRVLTLATGQTGPRS